MFAKLFETDIGQILVKADTSEDGEPEVRFYFKPAHLGICSMAITFEDNDSGWGDQEKTFDLITQESAIEAVNGVLTDFPMQT